MSLPAPVPVEQKARNKQFLDSASCEVVNEPWWLRRSGCLTASLSAWIVTLRARPYSAFFTLSSESNSCRVQWQSSPAYVVRALHNGTGLTAWILFRNDLTGRGISRLLYG